MIVYKTSAREMEGRISRDRRPHRKVTRSTLRDDPFYFATDCSRFCETGKTANGALADRPWKDQRPGRNGGPRDRRPLARRRVIEDGLIIYGWTVGQEPAADDRSRANGPMWVLEQLTLRLIESAKDHRIPAACLELGMQDAGSASLRPDHLRLTVKGGQITVPRAIRYERPGRFLVVDDVGCHRRTRQVPSSPGSQGTHGPREVSGGVRFPRLPGWWSCVILVLGPAAQGCQGGTCNGDINIVVAPLITVKNAATGESLCDATVVVDGGAALRALLDDAGRVVAPPEPDGETCWYDVGVVGVGAGTYTLVSRKPGFRPPRCTTSWSVHTRATGRARAPRRKTWRSLWYRRCRATLWSWPHASAIECGSS
jgi:hypothetical protein